MYLDTRVLTTICRLSSSFIFVSQRGIFISQFRFFHQINSLPNSTLAHERCSLQSLCLVLVLLEIGGMQLPCWVNQSLKLLLIILISYTSRLQKQTTHYVYHENHGFYLVQKLITRFFKVNLRQPACFHLWFSPKSSHMTTLPKSI